MGEWIADLLDLDFLAHQSFTNTESRAMTARSCPSGFGVCEGILYGPFQHGKILPRGELFECVDCKRVHKRSRLLCVNCRQDRTRSDPTVTKCFTGYCRVYGPQKCMVWGAAWQSELPWMSCWNYKVCDTPFEKRKADFLRNLHNTPHGIMLRFWNAMEPAGVGRDMQAETPAIAYGQGRNSHTVRRC